MTTPAHDDRGKALRRAGLLCTLVAACARVVTTHDPLPGWGLDPVAAAAPLDGVGPAGDMLLAVLAFVGLTLVLAGAARSRETIPSILLLLGALGIVPVVYHGWLAPDRSVENMHAGAAWAGAIAGGLAALIACRHPAERALAIATCAAIAAPLFFRAAIQVYSEHPAMVEDFRDRREEILAGHGWSPDSAMARGYERRLSQPDASAWFTMSNVYASVLAGCMAVFAAGVLAAVRARLWTTGSRHDLYRLAGLVLGLALSVGGLLLAVPAGGAPSKGALAAAALGLALLALAAAHHRLPASLSRTLPGGVVGVGVVALALAAVAIRGLVGERIGELSLLFRWFYMQAAARIFAEHPLWGVGPTDFQAAYLLAKNPLNPEEVASPHSALLEYASTLGALGLAWCALLLALAWLAGRTLLRASAEPAASRASPADRAAHLGLFAVIAPCAALGFLAEAVPLANSVPEASGLLLFDGGVKVAAWALLWLGLGAALLGVGRSRFLAAGLAAGALAVLAHSQIELNATDFGAAGWTLALLGAAASPTGARPSAGRNAWVGAALAGSLAIAALAAHLPVRAWQAVLRTESQRVAETTRLEQRFVALSRGDPGQDPRSLISDLSAATGRAVAPNAEAAAAALAGLRSDRIGRAADALDALARSDAAPSREVAHTAVRLRATHAEFLRATGGEAREPLRRAAELAEWATDRWPADSRAWRDLAQIRAALAPAGLAPSGADLDPLLVAAELDPYSPDLAFRLTVRLAELGRPEEAEHWAELALRNHEFRRLDPLARLSESQVARLRELLGVP